MNLPSSFSGNWPSRFSKKFKFTLPSATSRTLAARPSLQVYKELAQRGTSVNFLRGFQRRSSSAA